jgi:hypothetical protein
MGKIRRKMKIFAHFSSYFSEFFYVFLWIYNPSMFPFIYPATGITLIVTHCVAAKEEKKCWTQRG